MQWHAGSKQWTSVFFNISSVSYMSHWQFTFQKTSQNFLKSLSVRKNEEVGRWITRMHHSNMCICGLAVLLLGNCIFLRHDQQPALDLLHINTLPKHSLVYEKHHICLSSWSPNNFWIYQAHGIRHRGGTKTPLEAVFCSYQSAPNKGASYPSELKTFWYWYKTAQNTLNAKATSLGCPWTIKTIWTLPQDCC